MPAVVTFETEQTKLKETEVFYRHNIWIRFVVFFVGNDNEFWEISVLN